MSCSPQITAPEDGCLRRGQVQVNRCLIWRRLHFFDLVSLAVLSPSLRNGSAGSNGPLQGPRTHRPGLGQSYSLEPGMTRSRVLIADVYTRYT